MFKFTGFVLLIVVTGIGFSIYVSVPPIWVNPLLSFLGIVSAALFVVYQLNEQHKSSLKLQKENKRDELKLQVFHDLHDKAGEVSAKIFNSKVFISSFETNVQTEILLVAQNMSPRIPKHRSLELIDTYKEASEAVMQLMYTLEKYEIINPEAMKLFRIALSSSNYDVNEAYTNMLPELMKRLPKELDNGEIHYVPLSTEELFELKKFTKPYQESLNRVHEYIYDMNYEFQNILVKNLFPNEVTKRKPLDPNLIVLSTEPEELKRLMYYFDNETPHGKNRIETEEGLKKQYENEPSNI